LTTKKEELLNKALKEEKERQRDLVVCGNNNDELGWCGVLEQITKGY